MTPEARVTEMSPIGLQMEICFLFAKSHRTFIICTSRLVLGTPVYNHLKDWTLDPRLPWRKRGKSHFETRAETSNPTSQVPAQQRRKILGSSKLRKTPRATNKSSYLQVLAPSLRLDYNWEGNWGKVSGLVPGSERQVILIFGKTNTIM